ncbi:16075_t:CDS:2 [Cetraspora pellucida]|uniref:16075_t:CDS:1 n=1 Tax=Cetraspora pellucida TaxID=1433469 RepID=A0ACA9L4Y2_9GLOM|nr:16075_t:CDS:2 [Cetraspora pellucida]
MRSRKLTDEEKAEVREELKGVNMEVDETLKEKKLSELDPSSISQFYKHFYEQGKMLVRARTKAIQEANNLTNQKNDLQNQVNDLNQQLTLADNAIGTLHQELNQRDGEINGLKRELEKVKTERDARPDITLAR